MLEEWETGTHIPKPFSAKGYASAYAAHLALLEKFAAAFPLLVSEWQIKLLKNARYVAHLLQLKATTLMMLNS